VDPCHQPAPSDRAKIKTPQPRSQRFAKAPHQVRIIGGRFRRSLIPVAAASDLRPTPDRVRETLFNWLSHLRPDFSALSGLDLFAGSGALGFEFASRGARYVLMIERDPVLARSLDEVRSRLGADHVEIRRADAFDMGSGPAHPPFDVIFLDPPFSAGKLLPALELARLLMPPGGLVYAEAPSDIPDESLAKLDLVRIRHARAGRVHYYLLGLQQC
jgi:16S rRNA (guanine966-N2)-methyltransferase